MKNDVGGQSNDCRMEKQMIGSIGMYILIILWNMWVYGGACYIVTYIYIILT